MLIPLAPPYETPGFPEGVVRPAIIPRHMRVALFPHGDHAEAKERISRFSNLAAAFEKG